jgi:RNA polymerase sigma-70 factor (ECF subfamily)
LEQSEALAAMATAIDRLPHDLKTTLLLHHYEHLGYREISQIAGCSERGVETRLYRARQYLRAELTPFLREAVQS